MQNGVPFPPDVELDEEAKDFIRELMRPNPLERLGCEGILAE